MPLTLQRVTVTFDERCDGRLSDNSHQRAANALRSAGAVILEGAVDRAHLNVLKTKMDQAWTQQRTPIGGYTLGFNYVDGHLQQDPPDDPDCIFRDIVDNPFVERIVHDLAGKDARLAVYTGNTNSPGTAAQPLHSDSGKALTELEVTRLVTNIPLVNVTPKNGAIELWLGTHDADVCDKARRELVGANSIWPMIAPRAIDENPGIAVRANTKLGDVLIRDQRLWHRGMPNTSEEPRHMLALVHGAEDFCKQKGVRKMPFYGACMAGFAGSFKAT